LIIGPVVLNVFQNPEEFKSRVVGVASSYLTGQQYIDKLNQHLAPNKFIYNDMPLDQYEKLPFPGADDLARMFEFYQTEKMERDIELSKKLNKNLLDFDAWLTKNRESILRRLQ
jgi:hypothetical protein